MSGAAEGIAGLALGAVSVAALFTTCIECFDIIIAARDFSIDYELSVTELDVERLRFLLWGESVGLVPGCSEPLYNYGLDRPDVRPVVERTLLCIKHLLNETSDVQTRYGLKATVSTNLRGEEDEHQLQIFKATFDKFKNLVQKNQQQKSVWKVTRWAIHDATRFQTMITRLRGFVDGLENITRSLKGVMEKQQTRFREEIESVSDVESLRLLCDVSLNGKRNHSETASSRILSDTASQQLASLDDTSARGSTVASHPPSLSVDTTYYTAPSFSEVDRSPANPFDPEILQTLGTSEKSVNVPQNQRLLSAKLQCIPQNFEPSSVSNIGVAGSALASIQERDLNQLKKIVSRPPQKNAERSVLKRLSEFTKDPIPFISLAPIDSNIFDLLGSIEGPPGSPYEGGIFYIRIAIPPEFPFRGPKCRFLTKIYHPNIDAKGKLCLEVLGSCWEPRHGRLEKLLLAICALLDDPFVSDALVPEIAETYIQDRRSFNENARLYTKRFATGLKPVLSSSIRDFPPEKDVTNSFIATSARSTSSIYSIIPADKLASAYLETNTALIQSILKVKDSPNLNSISDRLVDLKLDWQRLSRSLVELQARLSTKLDSTSRSRTLRQLQDTQFLDIQTEIHSLVAYHQSKHSPSMDSQSRVPAFTTFAMQHTDAALWFAYGAAASVLKQAWASCLQKTWSMVLDLPPGMNRYEGPTYASSFDHAWPAVWNEPLSRGDRNLKYYYHYDGKYKFYFVEGGRENHSFPLIDWTQPGTRWISARPIYLVG